MRRASRLVSRDPLEADALQVFLDRLVGEFRDKRLRAVGVRSAFIDDGLVLADALAEKGYPQLGQALIKRLTAVRARAPGWAVGIPFLLRRVERAIAEIRKRKRRRRVKPARKRIEDPSFRRSYDWFREYGLKPESAAKHARAELFAERHGWHVVTEPEQERYQDVYGYSPENAAIERRQGFVHVDLIDPRGNFRDSIGMVVDEPSEIRYWLAELMLGHLGAIRRRRTERRTGR